MWHPIYRNKSARRDAGFGFQITHRDPLSLSSPMVSLSPALQLLFRPQGPLSDLNCGRNVEDDRRAEFVSVNAHLD